MSLKTANFECDIVRLQEGTDINFFDCGDADLNEFLHKDAKNYLAALLAVTYLVQTVTETLAYFSLSNDRITRYEVDKSEWNRLNRGVANEKRKRSYPAVKIGRLAVDKKLAHSGFGRSILLFIKKSYLNNLQQAGCRFITVDAYAGVTDFYEKNGFKFLTSEDKDNPARAMYFDLKSF